MADRLALSLVIGFAFGLLVASFFGPSFWLAGFCVFISALFFVAYRFVPRLPYVLMVLIFIGSACGIVRVSLAPLSLPEALRPLIETRVSLEGIIVAPPDLRETHQRLTVEIREGDATMRILVSTERYPKRYFGERILASGTLKLPEPFETDGGRLFRYDRFLAKDGVFAVLPYAKVESIAQEEGVAKVLGGLFLVKPGFLDALGRALPEPHASLAGGLIVGGKEGLGDELLDAFIATGLIHIVVLSGYNIMIIADAVLRSGRLLSRKFKTPKTIASLLAGLTIGLFVLAAGAGAASIRAGLMALVAVFARASGRVYDALRALLFIGVLMLLHNPLLLAYDPGFQLSFIATIGLIVGVPITERWFSFIKTNLLREIAAATTAAQIAVVPLLLFQTGLFSVVSLPANFLVLPVIPFAMAFSVLAGLGGFFLPSFALLFGLPAFLTLSYIISITEIAAHLPLAAIFVPAFPFGLTLLAYGVLGFFVWRATLKLPLLSPRASHKQSNSH